MPNFLETVFAQLEKSASRVVIREIRGESFHELTGSAIAATNSSRARVDSSAKFSPGDRVAMVGPNSMRWIAIDLALMVEGLVVVPLYYRQAPGELVAVMRDCQPKMLIADGGVLRGAITAAWPADAGFRFDTVLFDEILATSAIGRAESQTDSVRLKLASRLRTRHHRLHVGNIGRAERRLPQHRQRFFHAGSHDRPPQSAHARLARPRQYFSLSPAEFRRFVDCNADIHVARQRRHALDRSQQTRRRNSSVRAALFSQCSDAAGTSAPRRR